MYKIEISSLNTEGMRPRFLLKQLQDFSSSDLNREGKIMVLYGLRRTGKTVLMEQLAKEFSGNNSCAIYEVQDGDTLHDIEECLIKAIEGKTTLVMFDEITKARDFITRSSSLPDIFAKEGIKIIVTGTDTLGFQIADKRELFDRTIYVNTTHIPLAEHCAVFGIKDIDDYIEYGGLMSRNSPELVHDYTTACRYLDSAVAGNIANSLSRGRHETGIGVLSKEELSVMVNRLVQDYSGEFNKRVLEDELDSSMMNQTIRVAQTPENRFIISRLISETDRITEEYLKEINASGSLQHEITRPMVEELRNTLFDMEVLSATTIANFVHDETGWHERAEDHEYYLVQPAIRYYHLKKAIEFVYSDQRYRDLGIRDKQVIERRLENSVRGTMTEQIVLYDTMKDLPSGRYKVLKPTFKEGSKTQIGEYDMLICDKPAQECWGFEIKHNDLVRKDQTRMLANKDIQDLVAYKYGDIQQLCVLYRGKAFKDRETGIVYLNIVEFAAAINQYHDCRRAMTSLMASIPVKDIEEIASRQQNPRSVETERSVKMGRHIRQ